MKRHFLAILLIPFSFILISCSSRKTEALHIKGNENMQSMPKSAMINGLPAQINPGSYITFNSAEKLSDISDLIVIGQPINNLEESKKKSRKDFEKFNDKIELDTSVAVKDEDGKIISYYMLASVKIKKVLKGNLSNKVIGVIQSGAVIEENSQQFIMATEGFTPLEKSSKYLLFLKEIDPSVFPELSGMYSIISVNQGKFNLDKSDKQEVDHESKSSQYKNLKEKVGAKYKQEFDSAQ